MKINMKTLLPVLFAVIASSCVSNKKFSTVQQQRDEIAEDLSICRQRTNNLEANLSELRQEAAENEQLVRQLASAKNTIAELTSEVEKCETELTDGVVFKVQIGAFKQRDISVQLDQSVNLDIEETREGMDKVMVGQFREFKKADELKKHLRAMGVNNAWIVAYENGKRVALGEVTDVIFETNRD
jgi:uncharacterized protein YigA (DUF484 family)